MTLRAEIEVETLLKVVLGLVIVWILLEIVGQIVDILTGIFWILRPVLGLLVVVLIVLWLFDRI